MNKGDTVKILLALSLDGTPVTYGQLDEIELILGPLRLTLTDNDITWDSTEECYVVSLSQTQTLQLNEKSPYQIRVLKDGSCVSTDLGTFYAGEVLSNTVLTGA